MNENNSNQNKPKNELWKQQADRLDEPAHGHGDLCCHHCLRACRDGCHPARGRRTCRSRSDACSCVPLAYPWSLCNSFFEKNGYFFTAAVTTRRWVKKKRKKGKTINHSQKREKRDLRQSDVNSTIEKKREKVEENMK